MPPFVYIYLKPILHFPRKLILWPTHLGPSTLVEPFADSYPTIYLATLGSLYLFIFSYFIFYAPRRLLLCEAASCVLLTGALTSPSKCFDVVFD